MGDLEPLRARKLLIGVLALAVEPAALVPIEPWLVTVVEDALQPSMCRSSDDVLTKEGVQFPDAPFEALLFEVFGRTS